MVVAAAVLAGCFCWVAAANADVYWISGGNGDAIGRANDDGTEVNQNFISGLNGEVGLAVGSQYIYWNNGVGTIGRANLSGSGVDQTFITGLSELDGVAVNSQYIYWISAAVSACNGAAGIGRANLDGTGVNQGFICGVNAAYGGLAVDSQHIYWGWGGGIASANLNGTGVNENFVTLSPGFSAGGVAVDSQYIYWGSPYNVEPQIGRAPIAGGGPYTSSFIIGAQNAITPFVAVDSQNIYWTYVPVGPGSYAIGQANIDGSGVNESFISNLDGVGELAVGPGVAAPSCKVVIDGHCPPFTPAQIKGLLQTEIGTYDHQTKIPSLLKHDDYPLPFSAPTSGRAVIDWYYLTAGAHLAKAANPVVIASGQRTFSSAGRSKITLRLTAKGINLLKHSKRIRLTAKGTFTRGGQRPVTATKRFTLTA